MSNMDATSWKVFIRVSVLLLSDIYLTEESCPENCALGSICDGTDSGCATCKTGFWGRQCQHPNECKTTTQGSEYQGYKNTTFSGLGCQMWTSQYPQVHTYYTYNDSVNYCRSSSWDAAAAEPWCYTLDPNVRWEYCGIQFCSNNCPVPALAEFGDVNPPPEGFKVGTSVLVEAGCGPGTVAEMNCQANKTWSSFITCTDIKWCPKPKLNDTHVQIPLEENYFIGANLTINCIAGYRTDDANITCRSDKSWGTIPMCTEITTTSSTTINMLTTALSSPVTSTSAAATTKEITTTTASSSTTSTTASSSTTTTSAASTTTKDTETTTSFDTGGCSNNQSCVMVCNENSTLTQTELNAIIQQLKEVLTVNKKETTNFINSRISVQDKRQSAAAIGYAGAIVMTTVFVSIIIADVPQLVIMFKTMRENVRSRL